MYICDNYASYLSVRGVIRLSGTNILHYIIYSSFVSSSFGLRFGKNNLFLVNLFLKPCKFCDWVPCET